MPSWVVQVSMRLHNFIATILMQTILISKVILAKGAWRFFFLNLLYSTFYAFPTIPHLVVTTQARDASWDNWLGMGISTFLHCRLIWLVVATHRPSYHRFPSAHGEILYYVFLRKAKLRQWLVVATNQTTSAVDLQALGVATQCSPFRHAHPRRSKEISDACMDLTLRTGPVVTFSPSSSSSPTQSQ
jgi:hypothetical protein